MMIDNCSCCGVATFEENLYGDFKFCDDCDQYIIRSFAKYMENEMAKRQTVYLAGPISGLNYDQASDWREQVRIELEPELEVLSPMRDKGALKELGVLEGTVQYGHIDIMSAPSPVFARDRNDVRRSDIILVNFLGATEKSLGTTYEIGMARTLDKIVVMAIEPKGNPHDHVFITEAVSIRVATIEEAIYATRSFAGV